MRRTATITEAKPVVRQQALSSAQQQTLERAVAGAPLGHVLEPLVGAARTYLGDNGAAAVFVFDPESSRPRFAAASGLHESVAGLMTEAGAVAFLPKSDNSEHRLATILDAVQA